MKYTFFKKAIAFMMALVFVFQMTGNVFAATELWEAGNKIFSAYVNKGTAAYRYTAYSNTKKHHTKGNTTPFTLTTGSTTRSSGPATLHSGYDDHLIPCMNQEKLYTYIDLVFTQGNITLYLDSSNPSGNYAICSKVKGYSGTWGVFSAASQDSTMNQITSGSFSWAPSTYTDVVAIVLVE